MATPFSDIYTRALFKFQNYDFLKYTDEVKEIKMFNHLLASIVDFQYSCKSPLTYSELPKDDIDLPTTYAFDEDLDEHEKQILALGVAFHMLSNKVLSSEHLKNIIANSDYKFFSPGNLLSELQKLRSEIRNEYEGKINTYSFRNSDLANLKPNRGV